MKKLLAIALSLAFAATAAEAKTYYVNASRPNNNGNGLKASTAKKTIQAAINIAKKGDTILVYPGEYAPIKTNNKKIKIKSVKGAKTTKIVKPAREREIILTRLGKQWPGGTGGFDGQDTTLAGFLLDGKHRYNGGLSLVGVAGGTLKSCSIQRLGKYERDSWECLAAERALLVGCTVLDNFARIGRHSCLFSRCRIQNNRGKGYAFHVSYLANCLVSGNKYDVWATGFCCDSWFANCTIAENRVYRESSSDKVVFAEHNSQFYNCILWNNCHQTRRWYDGKLGKAVVHNVDSGNGIANIYSRTYKDNRNPKFVNPSKGDYRLKKGSPCIDRGRSLSDPGIPWFFDAQDVLGSTKDLAGKKRIRGKAIDMGCYEY